MDPVKAKPGATTWSCTAAPLSSSTAGFTLVELLVVIGLIALLIAILLPALARARDQSRTAACLSNLRQILQACHNYSSENKGVIIPALWERTASNSRPIAQSLDGNESWCTILVNGGYAQLG